MNVKHFANTLIIFVLIVIICTLRHFVQLCIFMMQRQTLMYPNVKFVVKHKSCYKLSKMSVKDVCVMSGVIEKSEWSEWND